jgi:uncharacterized protein YndB with AHSA1/START domain
MTTQAALQTDSGNIVVDEVLPHRAEVIWKALTDGALIAKWLMPPTGFAPVVGTRFTFRIAPAGAWDGTIDCQVLEVVQGRRLAYAWKSGHAGNEGYGAPLDTIVSFTLTPVDGGTRVQLVHSGFVLPRNELARKNMGEGWKKIIGRLGDLVAGGA